MIKRTEEISRREFLKKNIIIISSLLVSASGIFKFLKAKEEKHPARYYKKLAG